MVVDGREVVDLEQDNRVNIENEQVEEVAGMVELEKDRLLDAVNDLVKEARLLGEGQGDNGANSEGAISLAEEERLLG